MVINQENKVKCNDKHGNVNQMCKKKVWMCCSLSLECLGDYIMKPGQKKMPFTKSLKFEFECTCYSNFFSNLFSSQEFIKTETFLIKLLCQDLQVVNMSFPVVLYIVCK